MIAIRAAGPADAAAIAAIYAPYVAGGTVSFETDPPDTRAMRSRITASDGLYPWIVATSGESDIVLGYAYATKWRDRPAYKYIVETSIYMAGDRQQQGAGRLLYDALVDTLVEQDFTQAIAMIALPNDASITLHESCGFRRGGVFREVGWKQGRWIDVGLWQRDLADAENPPREPKRFADVGVKRY